MTNMSDWQAGDQEEKMAVSESKIEFKHLTNYEKPLIEKPEESFTLPSYLYTDPDVYELEKERIFYRTWQFVAHITSFEKPGDYSTCLLYTSDAADE